MAQRQGSTKQINGDKPGLFHLSLNASQNPLPVKFVNRISILHKLERDFPKCPGNFTNSAILNLLGAMYFYHGEAGKAVKCFKKILNKESNNKNARANLVFVYQRIHMIAKAEQFKEEVDSTKDTLVEAKFTAEQGFAMFFDVHLENDPKDRNLPPYQLLVSSLEMLKSLEPRDNCLELEIRYWFAEVCQKLHQASFRSEKVQTEFVFYEQGLDSLVAILKSGTITKEASFREGCWAYLFLFMEKCPCMEWEPGGKPKEVNRQENLPDIVKKT